MARTPTERKSQARRSNTKPAPRKPRRRYYPCNPPPTQAVDDTADQIVGDARKIYVLHALQVMNRRRYQTGFLFDDAEGHETFVCWRALGLREKEWGNVAPWFRLKPKIEREAFDQRTAEFAPTLRNVSTAARFTRSDRAKYAREERRVGKKIKRAMQALLQLPMIDANLEEVRKDERSAARRERWQKAHATATAKCTDPREIAAVEAVFLISCQPGCWHDYSVPNIIRMVERSDSRCLFPRSHSSFRVIVYRLIERLVKRGTLLSDHRLSDDVLSTSKFVTPCDPSDGHQPVPDQPNPLKDHHSAVTAYRPMPKLLAQDIRRSDPNGETAGLPKVEFGASASPDQQAATDAQQEHSDMATDEERIEFAYLRQRMAALEKKFGVRADDTPPQPSQSKPVETITGNVVRLRPK